MKNVNEVIGREYTNKAGLKAKVLRFEEKKKGNYYFECLVLSTSELKIIQLSNLNSGSWTDSRYEYPDIRLNKRARKDFDHLNYRCRNSKSYEEYEVKFKKYKEFYEFLDFYLKEERPDLYKPYVEGHLNIEKDLLNNLLGKKEYSTDTIILTSPRANKSEIKRACNIQDDELREKELLNILSMLDFCKWQKIKKALHKQGQ